MSVNFYEIIYGRIEMSNMQAIIWLFPIIFIIHDFEEIIFSYKRAVLHPINY